VLGDGVRGRSSECPLSVHFFLSWETDPLTHISTDFLSLAQHDVRTHLSNADWESQRRKAYTSLPLIIHCR
jgi:hypothetical protein